MDKLKKLFSCLAALCLTAFLLLLLSQLMYKKDSYAKHAEFFEQNKNAPYDVFFIGSSVVMNGVVPMELWEDQGIVSYNLAQAGHVLPASYWVMRMALDHYEPSLIVVDCHSMEYDQKGTSNFGLMHISFDSFPLNATKIRAIMDIVNDPSLPEGTNRTQQAVNLFWNFSVFHDRWNMLEANDFAPEKSYMRGSITNARIYPYEPQSFYTDEKAEISTIGTSYLEMIIEECQRRGIQVLITALPYPSDQNDQGLANYAEDIAAQYNVDFLNFHKLNVVDFRTDMADDNCHLNLSGARKVSTYLGNYIREHYSFPDHRQSPEYSNWEKDHARYIELKDQEFSSQQDLYISLMLLYESGMDACIYVQDSCCYMDAEFVALLENLSVSQTDLSPEARLILIKDGKPLVIDENALKDSSDCPVSIDPENGGILADGKFFPLNFDCDISISAMRGETLVDCVGYNYVYDPDTALLRQIEFIR